MFGFLIKKSFWDLWDNMGRIILLNFVFLLLFFGVLGTTYIALKSTIVATIILIVLIVFSFIIIGAAAAYIKDISDFRPSDFKELFKNIKRTWKYSVSGGILFSVIIVLTISGMRFYSTLGGMPGILGAIFLFWIFVTVILSSLYYFPVTNRLESSFLKMIKKCFLIFLDNPFLTFFVFLGFVFNLVFSILLILGPASALLLLDNNLRLLIYKYDYLEENPDNRKKIPWGALLLDDKEKIGPRTLRNTIFPWK